MFLVGSTIIVVGLQLLAIYLPFLQRLLHTVPLTIWDWMYAILIAMTILVFEEIRKWVVNVRENSSSV